MTLSDHHQGKFPSSSSSSSLKRNPPSSSKQVGEAVAAMDAAYKTSFQGWIRSQSNISYLCKYKRSLFTYHAENDLPRLAFVLRWLTEEWSVASVAELLLKLFYNQSVRSQSFYRIVAAVSHEWDFEKRSDLINVLLVGERAVPSAKFILGLTQSHTLVSLNGTTAMEHIPKYPLQEFIEVIREAARSLNWEEGFLVEFFMEVSDVFCVWEHQKQFLVGIRDVAKRLCEENANALANVLDQLKVNDIITSSTSISSSIRHGYKDEQEGGILSMDFDSIIDTETEEGSSTSYEYVKEFTSKSKKLARTMLLERGLSLLEELIIKESNPVTYETTVFGGFDDQLLLVEEQDEEAGADAQDTTNDTVQGTYLQTSELLPVMDIEPEEMTPTTEKDTTTTTTTPSTTTATTIERFDSKYDLNQ